LNEDTQISNPSNQGRKKKKVRFVAVMMALALMLGVGAGVFSVSNLKSVSAQTTTPGTTPSSQVSPPSGSSDQTGVAPDTFGGHGGKGSMGGRPDGAGGLDNMQGRGGKHGQADSTLTAVNGNTLTLTAQNGSTSAVTVDANTTYTRAGKAISLADLKTGDKIEVHMNQGATTASSIEVVLAHADGTITAVSGSTITLTERNSATQQVVVDASTSFLKAGQSASLADVTVGSQIMANGTLNSDGSLKAEQVVIQLPEAHGTVSKVEGATITLSDPRGNRQITVVTNSSTKFYVVTQPGAAQTAASLSDIATGKNIEAEGTMDANGTTLTALVVQIMPERTADMSHGR